MHGGQIDEGYVDAFAAESNKSNKNISSNLQQNMDKNETLSKQTIEEYFRLAKQIIEKEDGFAFKFPSSYEWMTNLVKFINTERKSKPSLEFDLIVESHEGPTLLEIKGKNAKHFVKKLLPKHMFD